jgi:hypothetical protein
MDIKEFDLDTIKQYPAVIVGGVRRSGKTRLTDYILNEIFDKEGHQYDDAFLLSSTAKQQPETFPFIDRDNIIDELTDDKIFSIFKRREEIMAHYKKTPELFKTPPNCLIIIDDLLNDSKGKSLWHSKPVSQLFFKGRHMGCSIIVLSQYVKALSPLMRSNADLFFYFRDLREDNRKCVLSEYLCFCNDKEIQKQGEQLMTDITGERYNAMVIDRYKGQYSKSFNEYVFKIKAPEKFDNNRVKFYKLPKLKMGLQMTADEEEKDIINDGLRKPKRERVEEPIRRIIL